MDLTLLRLTHGYPLRLRLHPCPRLLPINLLPRTPLDSQSITLVSTKLSFLVFQVGASNFSSDRWTDLHLPPEALSILLEFYAAQDIEGTAPHLAQIAAVSVIRISRSSDPNHDRQIPPPTIAPTRSRFYTSFARPPPMASSMEHQPPSNTIHDRTPSSSHGGNTPVSSIPNGRIPIKAGSVLTKKPGERLDLS